MRYDIRHVIRSTWFKLTMGLALVLVLSGVIWMAAQAQGTGPQGVLRPQEPLGTAFTYQGRLIKNDNPVNGTCDFQFSLWDAASGGTQVGSTQSANGVSVSDGYFTVTDLDFGTNAFAGEKRYLQIAVKCSGDADYTTLTGRVALEAAPYALYALKAPWSGLSGVPSGFADGVDNDTTYTAGTGLDLNGTEFSIASGYRLPQTCNGGQIAEWNGSAWVCGEDDTGGGGAFWSLTGNAGTNPGTNFLGTTDNQALELWVNNARALRLEPNAESPNVIGGHGSNGVNAGVYGATIGGGGRSGAPNRATANYATVGGGGANIAGGKEATIGGGWSNNAGGNNSTIGGGVGNTASSVLATVSGGWNNTASGIEATVGGGESNVAAGEGATIAGGLNITVTGTYAAVGGGANNSAGGQYAAVGGGANNSASGSWATIGGGQGNVVNNQSATVGGGAGNEAIAPYATVGGGEDNEASGMDATIGGGDKNGASGEESTIGGGRANRAGGGQSTICGGELNQADGQHATIGGGFFNTASGITATIGGGEYISVTAQAATAAGGSHITVSGDYATVGGGQYNTAYDYGATIGGGSYNTAGGAATIGGGEANVATGYASTVPGGEINTAAGDFSFAAGTGALALDQGSFVWSDSHGFVTPTVSMGIDSFVARAAGGFYLWSDPSATTGVALFPGAAAWAPMSDRNLKENFSAVDGREVLARLVELPISTWNYKAEAPSIRHMGPMAQDFHAAFGLGEDERHIPTVDADGVALAAIQGLHAIVQEQDARIAQLEADNAALQQRVESLEQENAALRDALDGLEERVATLEREQSRNISGIPQANSLLGGWSGLLALAAVGGVWAWRRDRKR